MGSEHMHIISEQRKYPRFSIVAPINVAWNEDGKEVVRAGLTKNVSAQGGWFMCREKCPGVAQHVRFEIALPDTDGLMIVGDGLIVRTAELIEDTTGIAYCNETLHLSDRFHNFLDDCNSGFEPSTFFSR